MNLSGSEVHTENVLVLASMLDGDGLAAKLDVLALGTDERQMILFALQDPPGGL
jgi:hypothetical protein